MSLTRFLTLACVVTLLTSCALEPEYNRYQLPGEQIQAGQGAVAELQRNAINALENQAYQQAIGYLQRAIKIEPRDALSWHYLAQTYWRSGDFKRCIEMSERSFSYSTMDDELDQANRRLKEKCQQG
jgi:Tfp pilus assembly protein PilF